jgi:excinuclease ABC subunit B
MRPVSKIERSVAPFEVVSQFQPSGDQPTAIADLEKRIRAGEKDVVLLGATGTGKSATTAWMIEKLQRPTLVMAPNKTLAAQLANEFRELLPNNAVEYFVSYYDYYQPEAYVPQTDTFIEKDSSLNAEVERLRHSATNALLSRRDVIVVSTVSCIYGLGSPAEYLEAMIALQVGMRIDRQELLRRFVSMQYQRNDVAFQRGTFRVRGDTIEIIPMYEEHAIRIELFGDEIESISTLHPLTGEVIQRLDAVSVFPGSHYVSGTDRMHRAMERIRLELDERLADLERQGRLLEAQRLRMRTTFDLEMMEQIGFCSGIENYSRHIDGREPGEAPDCLLDYFPEDFIVVIDESHVTVPQIGAMYEGDASRKRTLVEHGFRLPSALDNRPLKFDEFLDRVGQTVYLSATPARYERERADTIVEQIIRPTGLVDPKLVVKPVEGQIDDLLEEIRVRAERDERVLVTTSTRCAASSCSRSCAPASSTCSSASTCCARASTCPRCRSSRSSTPTRRASCARRRRSSRRSAAPRATCRARCTCTPRRSPTRWRWPWRRRSAVARSSRRTTSSTASIRSRCARRSATSRPCSRARRPTPPSCSRARSAVRRRRGSRTTGPASTARRSWSRSSPTCRRRCRRRRAS